MKSITLIVACGLIACAAGCSTNKAFNRAAGPVAEDVYQLELSFLSEKPGPASDADRVQADQWIEAVRVGDRAATTSLWFGNDNVREDYSELLFESHQFDGPGGDDIRSILLHHVNALDYIFAVGTTQPK